MDGSVETPPPAPADRAGSVRDSVAEEEAAIDAPSIAQEPLPTTAEVCVQVEAFGSGVMLHDGIAIAADKTVGDLRALVSSSIVLPPRTRTVRLFVDHGGAELDNDETPMSSVAEALDTKPIVVFPTLCTFCVWCRDECPGAKQASK